jgi:ELWxxDGT repeat protein
MSLFRAMTVAVCLSAGVCLAQTPYLVKDINATQTPQGSDPRFLGVAGSVALFGADAADDSYLLWKTDGTTAGTVRVHDGTSTVVASVLDNAYGFGVLDGRVIYIGYLPEGGFSGATALVSSDGTAGGTRVLYRYPYGSQRHVGVSARLGNHLYFQQWIDQYSLLPRRMWRTDGTAENTQIFDLSPMTTEVVWSNYAVAGGRMHFFGDHGVYGTDGTVAGTTLISQFGSTFMTTAGNRLVYFAGDGSGAGADLWSSDGTPAGTTIVRNGWVPTPSYSPYFLAALGNKRFFAANDGLHGSELWVTDGTAAGTMMMGDFYPGAPSSDPGLIAVTSDRAYFQLSRDGLPWLVYSDGTAGSLVVVKQIDASIGFSAGNRVCMPVRDEEHGTELWTTDGTEAGTQPLPEANPGPGNGIGYDGFLPFGGGVLFRGTNATNGAEPWFSDCTAAGTRMLANLMAESENSSSPRALTASGNRVLFNAYVGGTSSLWTSDGTNGGTTSVAPYDAGYNEVVVGSGSLRFYTQGATANDTELWRSDGTPSGTFKLLDIGLYYRLVSPAALRGGLFFFKDHPDTNRRAPWFSDGTVAGTRQIQMTPGPGTDSFDRSAVAGSVVYFVRNSYELWKTDGTDAGTVQIALPFSNELIEGLTAAGGRLYFFTGSNTSGKDDLWKIEPGSATAVKVAEVPHSSQSRLPNGQRILIRYQNELWVSDGTESGTKQIVANHSSFLCDDAAATLNGSWYWMSRNLPAGITELWRSDGTAAGTVAIHTWPEASCSSGLVAANGRLYFAASGSVPDRTTIWTSDGTSAGTFEVSNAVVGPYGFTAIGSTLYFSAVTIATGSELYALNLPACAPPSITAQPRARGIAAGGTTTLSVGATGVSDYQWYAGASGDTSTPVSGATSSSLNVSPSSNASYWVRLTGSCGSADSAAARVEIVTGWFFNADTNGDDKPDQLLRDTANGNIGVWLMNGTTVTGAGVVGTPGLSWRLAGGGDFNGDDKTDVMLQNSETGDVGVWLLDGTAISSAAVVSTRGTEWAAIGTADLNADGRSDIIFRNLVSGDVAGALMNGLAQTSFATIGLPGLTWLPVGSADFTADGRDDLLIRNLTNGDLGVWTMNGLTLTGGALVGTPGTAWRISGAADLNGDTKPDIVLQNITTGTVGGWLMNGLAYLQGAPFGEPGPLWRPVNAADFNQDGKMDIVVQNVTTGDIGRWQMNGLVVQHGFRYGTPGANWTAAGAR